MSKSNKSILVLDTSKKENHYYTDEDYVNNVNYYIERLTEDKNIYVNLLELVNRFVDIDEEYNHEDWNLMQILANINMVDHVKME